MIFLKCQYFHSQNSKYLILYFSILFWSPGQKKQQQQNNKTKIMIDSIEGTAVLFEKDASSLHIIAQLPDEWPKLAFTAHWWRQNARVPVSCIPTSIRCDIRFRGSSPPFPVRWIALPMSNRSRGSKSHVPYSTTRSSVLRMPRGEYFRLVMTHRMTSELIANIGVTFDGPS